MLTDGISQDRVARQASLMRAKGVEVFTVGIGRALKRRQLLQIATDRNHVSVVSFRGLATLSKAIRSKICQLIKPTGWCISLLLVHRRLSEKIKIGPNAASIQWCLFDTPERLGGVNGN